MKPTILIWNQTIIISMHFIIIQLYEFMSFLYWFDLSLHGTNYSNVDPILQ